MVTEKQVAITSVFIGMLIPVLTFSYQVISFTGTSSRLVLGLDDLTLWGANILFFWFVLLLACILYTRIRSWAVTGAALSITIIHIGFFCHMSNVGDPKIGALWLVYLLWGVAAFVFSILPACFKPEFLVKSARNSFLFSMLATLFSGIVCVF